MFNISYMRLHIDHYTLLRRDITPASQIPTDRKGNGSWLYRVLCVADNMRIEMLGRAALGLPQWGNKVKQWRRFFERINKCSAINIAGVSHNRVMQRCKDTK